MKDTLAIRWARLMPHVRAYGPADRRRRPAVLLFHGCGGVREHMGVYAEAAAAAGYRAFVVDSYAPRGWSRAYALAMVCTGLRFRGDQRTGDVLAALWGLSQRPDVDASRLVLAGWSHGSWTIMDLMTLPLVRPGEADLADAHAGLLDGVIGTFLVYPFLGPIARSRRHPWLRRPQTFGLVAETDHITGAQVAAAVYDRLAEQGVPTTVWRAAGTHAFDEPGTVKPMVYDADLTAQAVSRWQDFLRQVAGLKSPPRTRPSRVRA